MRTGKCSVCRRARVAVVVYTVHVPVRDGETRVVNWSECCDCIGKRRKAEESHS